MKQKSPSISLRLNQQDMEIILHGLDILGEEYAAIGEAKSEEVRCEKYMKEIWEVSNKIVAYKLKLEKMLNERK